MGVMPGARYRVSDEPVAPVEAHPLVCEECRARLAERDAYVRAMRAAMRVVVHRRSASLSPLTATCDSLGNT
jgi:hypothetical protein